MPAKCAARGCTNVQAVDKTFSFHRLPKHNQILLNKWLLCLQILKYSKNTVVCSSHFVEDDFKRHSDRKLLKDNAVPFSAVARTPPKSLCASKPEVQHLHYQRSCTSINNRMTGKVVGRKLNFTSQEENTSPQTHYYFVTSDKDDHNYALPSPKTLKMRMEYIVNKKTLEMRKKKAANQKIRRLNIRLKKKDLIINDLNAKIKDSTWHALCDNYFTETCSELFKNHVKGKKPREYSEKIKQFAVTLHFYSPHAYSFLRQHISLPHPRTIREWASRINGNPGFTLETFKQIEMEVKKSSYKTYATLIVDEMAIKKQVDFDGQHCVGYCNLGHEELDSDNAILAHEALVFYCKAVNASWKFPIGYCLINSLDGNTRKNIICQYIRKLHETGVVVVAFTCDGNATNVATLNKLGVRCDLSTNCCFSHPCDKSLKIRGFLDVVHMLKLFRNLLGEIGILIDGDGKKIEWNYLVQLNNIQKREGIHSANKLRDKHIFYENQKMKVNLAAQTLSRSVAKSLLFLQNTMKLPEFQNVGPTIKFIETIDTVFDIMNTVNIVGRGSKAPIRLQNKEYVVEKLESAVAYLKKLRMPDNTLVYMSRRKTPVVGFILDIYSTLSLAEELVWTPDPPLKYMLLRSVSQDHIEKFFSCIRKRTGNNNNPTALQFKAAYRKCILGTVDPSSIGNCTVDLQYDFLPSSVFFNQDLEVVDDSTLNYEDLTEFSNYVVEYVAGFIGKKIRKKINCDDCLNISISQEKTDSGSLIDIRNINDSLIVPSKFLLTICVTIEKVVRALSHQHYDESFTNKVFYLSMKNIGLEFFSTYDHLFNDEVEERSHFNVLLKYILKSYVRLRAKHMCAMISQEKKGVSVRQKFNKLTLFYGH